jgi:coproporphyrinogen III oxidase-like Fe-S oxidoreductase
VRSGNARSIADYRRRIEAAGRADVWSELPPPRTRLAETWWLGLRLSEGLSAEAALERAQVTLDELGGQDPTAPVVVRLTELGLLERTGAAVRLSAAGLPLADAVAKEFLGVAVDEQAATSAPRSSVVAK